MLQAGSRHIQEVKRDMNISLRHMLQTTPLQKAHSRVDNRLRSKPMNAAVFQTEDVPSQMESADLTSPVGQQLVGPNCTVDHLVDVFRRLRLSVYLGAPVVPKFAQIDAGTGKLSELTKGILLTSGSGVDVDKHGIPPVCANLVFVKIPYTMF